jgi:oligopeptidase A
VLPALEGLLQAHRSGMEAALASGKPASWALVESETAWVDELGRAWAPVSHLNSVSDSEALREAYNQGLERLTEHDNWRQQHTGIFRAYRELRKSPEFESLTAVQRRIIDLELRDFELAGVGLPEEDKVVYRELVMRMSKLGSRFAENLLDATRAWTLGFDGPERLAGLPEAELNLLQGLAAQRGETGWLIDLSFPAFNAVMTHAEDRALRQEVYTAYVTRASDEGPNAGRWDNTELIDEFLALRHRMARLLGYDNYVSYALARRMADSPEAVLEFLFALADKAVPAAREQQEKLESFALASGARLPLEPWDVPYWAERLRKAEIDLSDELLKPYFPLERMLEALVHTTTCVFGVTMVEDDSIETWHPDVKYIWLEDESGSRFAGLYLDLYTRQDKRGGAWMDVCLSRRAVEDSLQMPVAFLTCNFAPPHGDQPSLLTHDDVQTLFHEFGHCLHHLLTVIEWPQINGINNVEWDAVELPSQLLEYWCWESELFDRFARHYQTGQAMPAELKNRMLKSRTFHKAIFLARQLEYAITDMRLHLEYDPQHPRKPLEVLEEVRDEVAVVRPPQWNRFLNSFSHIFGGGYAAGYYSYLWAEQLAADAWGRFREEGAFAAAAGRALKDEILAVGASRPAMDSFIAFRGRPPEAGPLLKSYGLDE